MHFFYSASSLLNIRVLSFSMPSFLNSFTDHSLFILISRFEKVFLHYYFLLSHRVVVKMLRVCICCIEHSMSRFCIFDHLGLVRTDPLESLNLFDHSHR